MYNFRCYYLSIMLFFRQYYSGNSNTVNPPKMQSKVMSLTQWKLLNQLKDYVQKFSNDKKLQNAVNKEITQFLQKLQPSVYASESIRFFDSTSTPEATPAIEDKSSFSNVLNGLKIKINKENENNKEIVPKWKTSTSTISKVSSI